MLGIAVSKAQALAIRTFVAVITVHTINAQAFAKDVYFDSPVSRSSVETLLQRVTALAEKGDRQIRIRLESDGGDLKAALSAFEELRALGVTTYVRSHCHSACTVLFAAGRVRAANDYAKFLFHGIGVQGAHGRDQRDEVVRKYEAMWLDAIRSADPRLADELERDEVLLHGERYYSGRELMRSGFVNSRD